MISSPNWMDKLCSLMEKYYCCDTRTNVRLKALTVLSSILGSYRYTFEEELIEVIVFPYLLSIHEDNDMTVRAAVTQLLVNLAHHCDMPHFFTIVNAISKVANRDTKLKKDQKSGCWLRETDDIETAIIGLIGLFKFKLFHLPSTHCFYLYESLVTHIQLHYERKSFNQDTAGILQKVFECLLRLRSDGYRHLGFLNNDGHQVFSCFVMCDGSLPNPAEERRSNRLSPLRMSSPANLMSIPCTHSPLNFVTAFDLSLMCLQQELDKNMVANVLRLLCDTLSNHTLILGCNADLNTLCQILCRMVNSYGVTDVSTTGRQHRPELAEFVYPVLTVLATYSRQLEKKNQLELIQCIELGIRSRSSHACIESLSLCCMEMQNIMARLMLSVLTTLSQLSATVALALPVLEFFSTLACLDELYKGFHESQYRAIFATALPYTDLTKFSVQVVSLAYHVIFTWFVKTSLPHRKALVKFISKGLHRVTSSLPDSNHDSQTVMKMDGLSSNGSLLEEVTERGSLHRMKSVASEFLFQEEMREVCLDLMLRYTYLTCYTQPTRSALASSLISGGQKKHWLVGNSIVTITTATNHQLSASVGSSRALTPGVSLENSTTSSAQLSPVRSTSGYDSWKPPSLDISYCQGWAEVWVRRPTGNMAWMMKMENKPEHCRKSMPVGVFNSSTLGLHVDDLNAVSGHSAFYGVPPQSPLSTGLSLQSARQKTPLSMVSPVIQTHPVFDVLADDINNTKTDRKIFQLDSPQTKRQFQQKETVPTPVPSQRSRKPELPKLYLGMSPLDHEQVMPMLDTTATHIDQNTDQIVEVSVESPISDSAIQGSSKPHRRGSCPQLQSENDTRSLNCHVLVQQQSREAEDVLCSPTSPELDKTLLTPSNMLITSSMFPAVQRTLSNATTATTYDDALDPSSLFLQLYGHLLVRTDDERQPVLLPLKNDYVERSLKVMDHLQPYNSHKIGVIYIAKGQHTETAILSNECGSSQYFRFLSGLGELISLSDCRSNDIYLGGLSQTGEDGQYTYVWTDEISQVVFHVATLMTNRANDPQCHAKKRHIGNDFVKIVFNESGDEYQPGAKAQFNLVDIVISAASDESYQVTVHTKTGITPPIYDANPKIVSDECLPLVVRQMAFHADLSCMAYYSEQSPGDQTMNWIERLRKIKHLYSKIALSDKGNDVVFTDYT
jgi:tuberous sclerosis protein 2